MAKNDPKGAVSPDQVIQALQALGELTPAVLAFVQRLAEILGQPKLMQAAQGKKADAAHVRAHLDAILGHQAEALAETLCARSCCEG